jgi:hypothetical protein
MFLPLLPLLLLLLCSSSTHSLQLAGLYLSDQSSPFSLIDRDVQALQLALFTNHSFSQAQQVYTNGNQGNGITLQELSLGTTNGLSSSVNFIRARTYWLNNQGYMDGFVQAGLVGNGQFEGKSEGVRGIGVVNAVKLQTIWMNCVSLFESVGSGKCIGNVGRGLCLD